MITTRMFPLLAAMASGIAATGLPVHVGQASALPLGTECGTLGEVHESNFLIISQWLVSHASAANLRRELAVAPWPADSVAFVSDSRLCGRVDSLVVSWLQGPGLGKLPGFAGTIAKVSVTRIGPTVFHVRPGASTPKQDNAYYPYFVVDTAAPARVVYWAGTNGD